MRTVTLRVHHHQLTSWECLMNIVPNGGRSDRIFIALENERSGTYLWQVSAIVRKKSHSGKMLREDRVGSAKTRLNSPASSGQSGLPIMTGAIIADHPR